MDIMTISSLAGLGAVPGSVRTYADARTYLGSAGQGGGVTLYDTLATLGGQIDAEFSNGLISSSVYQSLLSQYQALDQRVTALYSAFSGKSGALETDDATSLSALDTDIETFGKNVIGAKSGTALKIVLIGLAGLGAAGLVVWAVNKMPSYVHKRRKRRRR